MIKCVICQLEFKNINKRHLISHGISRLEYIEKYPDAPLQSAESAEIRHAAALRREAEMSDEARAAKANKIAESMVGNKPWNSGVKGYKLDWSDEARARVAERGAHNKGMPRPEEQKEKQSATMTEGYASGRIIHWNLGNVTPDNVREKIAKSCALYELTPEQKEKQLNSIKLWIESPAYVNSMKGKSHSSKTRKTISESGIAAAPKTRKTMEEAGNWIPLAQLPAVLVYRRAVWQHTNRNAHLIPGYDPSKRGRCSKTKDTWQIDHKLSIIQGWLDDITPEQLSHPVNLDFIPWRENHKKWHRSTLTKSELLAKISELA